MAPDLRRKVDANRAARMAQERVLKEQIEAQASSRSPPSFSNRSLHPSLKSDAVAPRSGKKRSRSRETHMGGSAPKRAVELFKIYFYLENTVHSGCTYVLCCRTRFPFVARFSFYSKLYVGSLPHCLKTKYSPFLTPRSCRWIQTRANV